MSKEEAYVFIDGNNFYHNVKKLSIKPSHVDFTKLCDFICSKFECKRGLTLYYNSIPSIKDGEKMYYDHIKFLNKLRKLPRFEVKTRKLQRQPTKETLAEKDMIINDLDFCEKCRPLVISMCHDCIGNVKKREKGIDVMIAVDMINLSIIENKCDFCILVSGDADFISALNIIENKGKRVATSFVSRGYSYELRKNFDFLIISKNDLIENCLKSSKVVI